MASLPQRMQQVIVSEPSSIDTPLNHHGLHLLIITHIIRPLLVATSPPQHIHLCPINDTPTRRILHPKTIHDHIEATVSGDIEYLFTSAIQSKRLTQNSRSTYTGNSRCIQCAANTNDYSTAVALACFSQSTATIGPNNILHVNKLYTPPVPNRGHPDPNSATPHQSYSLTGDICHNIFHSKKNKGAGINSNSISSSPLLSKAPSPPSNLT